LTIFTLLVVLQGGAFLLFVEALVDHF
jgi:hypothetical protein